MGFRVVAFVKFCCCSTMFLKGLGVKGFGFRVQGL